MRWIKVAAIAAGILIAFLIVGSVVGFILHVVTYLVIAALVVGGVAVAIKVARSGKQVSRKHAEREVREPDYDQAAAPGRCRACSHLVPGCDLLPVPAGPAGLAGHRRRAGQAEARDGRLSLTASWPRPAC